MLYKKRGLYCGGSSDHNMCCTRRGVCIVEGVRIARYVRRGVCFGVEEFVISKKQFVIIMKVTRYLLVFRNYFIHY